MENIVWLFVNIMEDLHDKKNYTNGEEDDELQHVKVMSKNSNLLENSNMEISLNTLHPNDVFNQYGTTLVLSCLEANMTLLSLL
ncbi:hypothetical protein ABK040_009145 [Willaertia magna]